MAYTKIFAVRDHLSRIVSYAVNPDKIVTEDGGRLSDMLAYAADPVKTGQRLFEGAINCSSPDTAWLEMMETKAHYSKRGGVLAYHVIQSFKPGEVTAEQAHEIGIQFAQQMWGDRFEVVVGTHLDKSHYHNHIVVNSVSFADGKKYHSSPQTYFKDIRGTSDTLCREHGLSVIDPQGRGKHYKQWLDEKQGKPSGTTLIKADIDDAIRESFTFAAFIKNMKKRGYGVKCGPNVMHMAVKPMGGRKNFRLDTFRDPMYTEAGIRERILATSEGRTPDFSIVESANTGSTSQRPPPAYTPQNYKLPRSRPWRKPRRLKGFIALYWKYCYLLRESMHRKLPNRAAFLHGGSSCLRDELRKFDRYQRQFLFLYRNQLTTHEDLAAYRAQQETAISAHVDQRKALYIERRDAGDERQAEISAQIQALNDALRRLRQKVRLCSRIAEDAVRLQATCEQVDAEMARQQDLRKPRQDNEKQRKDD